MRASSFSVIFADGEEEVFWTSSSRKGLLVMEGAFHLRQVESKFDEIEMSSQHGDEATHVVRCGKILVDVLCDAGEKGSSFLAIPELRGCTPRVLSRLTEQLFDIFVIKGALLVQQDSKIPQSRSILSKEWVRLSLKLTEELANRAVPMPWLIAGEVLIATRAQFLKVPRRWSRVFKR